MNTDESPSQEAHEALSEYQHHYLPPPKCDVRPSQGTQHEAKTSITFPLPECDSKPSHDIQHGVTYDGMHRSLHAGRSVIDDLWWDILAEVYKGRDDQDIQPNWLGESLLIQEVNANPTQDVQHEGTRSITTPRGWGVSPSQGQPQGHVIDTPSPITEGRCRQTFLV